MKKKLLCFSAALAMLLALPACGKKDDASSGASSAASSSSQAENGESSSDAQQNGQQAAPVIPGKLYALNLADSEQPVIRGISLDGNQAGTYQSTAESVNGRAPSDSEIRFVFMMNEWISIIPDTDKTDGLTAYILEHQTDPAAYTDSFFAALTGDVPTVSLQKPEDEGGYGYWGELYLNPESWKAGAYDLVITDGGKPVACVMLNMYDEGALADKTDAELNRMMADARAAAENK